MDRVKEEGYLLFGFIFFFVEKQTAIMLKMFEFLLKKGGENTKIILVQDTS